MLCSQDHSGCFSDMRVCASCTAKRPADGAELVIKLKDNISVYSSGMQTVAHRTCQCDPRVNLANMELK